MEMEMEMESERVHHLHLISSSPPSLSPWCVTVSAVVMCAFHRILMTTNAMESPLECRHILATTHRTCSVILGAAGSMPPGNKSMLRASRNLHHPRRLPGAPGSVLVASSVRVMNMALAASSTTLISSLMRNVLGLSGSRLRYADAIRALSSLSHWSHRLGMCLVSVNLLLWIPKKWQPLVSEQSKREASSHTVS